MVERLINDVLVRMYIEGVTAKLEAPSWHGPERTEEDHKNSTSYIQKFRTGSQSYAAYS